MLLRLGGIFYKPTAAAIAGTVLCNATLGVFAVAVVLANNDRRAETRAVRRDTFALANNDQQMEACAERADRSAEAVSDSSALDDATTPQAEEGNGRQRDDDALEVKGSQPVVQGCSSPPDDKYGLEEESKNPPPELDASPSWLTRVMGGELCFGDSAPTNGAEAL